MICDSRLFAPIDYQPVFLGCSVSSWSAQIGWGENTSQLTVKLYQDPCAATGTNYKVTYDVATKAALGVSSDNVSQYLFQQADPGWVNIDAGAPVYFRMGDSFEFGGIIANYQEARDSSQNPGYTVTLNDPREILQGCQVVLGGYIGGVYSTPNVFNVYAQSESLGTQCNNALLSDLTGPGRFGGSNRNEAGISWNRVKRMLSIMTSHLPKLENNWGLGRIKFGDHEYLLDISEIPDIVGYRFATNSLSIAEIINEITTFLGIDYFVQLLYLTTEGGELVKVIKVRTASRRVQPDLNQISNFIGDGDGVIASSKGRELRNDTCSSVLVGGPKQELFVQTSNHELVAIHERWKELTISPFWGFQPDGGVIVGQGLNMDHNFNIDISPANITDTTNRAILTWYNISVAELHACLAGKDVWKTYVALHKTYLFRALGLDEAPLSFMDCFVAALEGLGRGKPGDIGDIAIHQARMWNLFKFYIDQLANGVTRDNFILPSDLISMRKHFTTAFDNWLNSTANFQRIQINLDTIFQIVENYATNYYGQQFMIRLTEYDLALANQEAALEANGSTFNLNTTFICTKYDSESDKLVFSKDVSDGGWTDFDDNLMGVQDDIALDRFRLNDGRIQPFVRFNSAEYLQFPDLNNEDYIYQDLHSPQTQIAPGNAKVYDPNPLPLPLQRTLYVKCTVNNNFVFPSNGYGNFDYSDPRVVISLPSIIKFQNPELEGIPYFLQFLFREGQAIQAPNDAVAPEFTEEKMATVIRNLMTNLGSSALHTGEDFLRAAPNAVCVALRSNIATYGPWFAIGANGKTNYSQNEDLVPWNYGGTVAMSNAGALLVTSELTNMLQAEAGHIEVPGLPILNLGDELQSGGSSITATRNILLDRSEVEGEEFTTATLETDILEGVYGPNVSNIDVSMSVTDGVKTRYSFRTFTPSFGSTNRYLAERIKNRSVRAQQRRRERRETFAQQEIKRLVNDIINQRIRDRQNDTGLFAKSPHMVLVGQSLSYPRFEGASQRFTRHCVQTQNLMESKAEFANWENKHFMSLDGLLRPIHTSGFYSYKKKSSEEEGEETNKSLLKNSAPAIPPIKGSKDKNTRITAYTLNPFITNNVGVNNLDKEEYPFGNNACGHDIEYLARGSTPPEDLAIQHNDDYATAYLPNNTVDYRAVAFKGPMLMTAWGFDLQGKPVPNASGADGPSDKFEENWLKRSDLWKTGPVDFRWDNNRGVWTCFPGYSLIQAKMTNTVSHEWGTTGTAILIGLPEDYKVVDEDGVKIETDEDTLGPEIEVLNTINYPLRKGMQIICYYHALENKYWVIQAPQPIYSVYIPDNISPRSSTEVYYSGIGFLYDNTMLNFNDHIETETGSINIITIGMPIRGNSEALCMERKLNEFWLIKNQARPLCVITDVSCDSAYTANGTTDSLMVQDRTIWLESNITTEEAGCNVNPAPGDFEGYEPDGA